MAHYSPQEPNEILADAVWIAERRAVERARLPAVRWGLLSSAERLPDDRRQATYEFNPGGGLLSIVQRLCWKFLGRTGALVQKIEE